MKRIALLIITLSLALTGKAQLTPLKSQYFKNPYLVNPAMAGKEEKTRVYLNYSSQWNKIEGSPVLMSLSASTRVTEKAAIGVNIISDKAGLLQKTQAMGSFAYKVPLTDEQSLRFGVSLAWSREQLDLGIATNNGSPDLALSKYNDQAKSNLDGNFGVVYVNKALEAQFSYLNLNQKRTKEFSTVDYSVFYSAVSYEFMRESSFTIKPLIAYRGVKGYKNQWDATAEWSYNKMVSVYTMYHSNQSFSAGAGYDYQNKLSLAVIYNSEPSQLRGFTGGIMDLMVGFNF
ncbi:MAG TPA: PorP/SprF family type IX secretion system membrane protein [Pedobacter sp.]|jgi:type IX secretion system PorP/SprF family membrane protein